MKKVIILSLLFLISNKMFSMNTENFKLHPRTKEFAIEMMRKKEENNQPLKFDKNDKDELEKENFINLLQDFLNENPKIYAEAYEAHKEYMKSFNNNDKIIDKNK